MHNLKPLRISDIKVPTDNNLYVGTFWIPLRRVIEIHEKLSDLAQIAEISLPSVPEVASQENIYESIDIEDKPIDTDLENIILHCCSEIEALFSMDKDKQPLPLTEKSYALRSSK